jgi:hypothetical protein
MTAEELAMANLELAAASEDERLQQHQEDLLNFNEVPSAVSTRNLQASQHIMQMFGTQTSFRPPLPPKPVVYDARLQLHLQQQQQVVRQFQPPQQLRTSQQQQKPQQQVQCAEDWLLSQMPS